MKNLKKVLAMVLAFACTFTMFASAKVYTDVPAGSTYSEAITMLSDLGIIQGKSETEYKPDDTITRAEACALIARLLTGDPNVENFGNAQNFTDVVKGSWQASAIGYCVANGITVGVGNGKFDPNRPINDQEFLTMMVRALGYETPDVKQNYPFGYMTAAKNIGLVENTQMLAGTDALRGEDAQVIYNALFVDYAKGAKIYNTTHGSTVERYPTLAESVWGLHQAAVGTWNKKDSGDVELSNCKAHTWVIIGEAKDEEDALLAYPIDDTEGTELYKADDKKNQYKTYKFKYTGDADALKGYKVELWGAGKHGAPVWEKDGDKFVYSKDWTIKAIKTVAGQTKYDYNSSMADKKADDGSIVIDADTTLALGSVADNAKNVKHADEIAEVATFLGNELNTIKIDKSKDVEKALNVRNGMQFRLMDWDGDKDIDWVVVDEARYYKVESASKKRVTVTSMQGDKKLESDKDSKPETWKIDESEKIGTNDAKKDIKIKYEVPEGLQEGDIVEVTYKVTFEDKAQLITATVKTVDADNQKLEKVGTRDGLTLTFGDQELKVAQNAKPGDVIVPANPDKYKGFNGEELGTEFALYKNRNGFIVYSDYATKSSNYMMVLNTYGGQDSTGKRDLAVIDMIDSNNSVRNDVKVSSTARVLDKNGDTLSKNGDWAYDKRKFDESQVVGRVFKYWTDEDGVITKMQSVFDNKIETNATSENYEYNSGADRLIDKGNNNRYVSSLERADAIFAVKTDYIKVDKDTKGPILGNTDLKVNSADVLATKQKDIPDIKTDPAPAKMLGTALGEENSWLGNKETKYQFVVEMNKNSEASAAILGVNNFNKFGSGDTKLALVTNISEDSKGVIEAEVAFDGKVETVASVEKQKFEDIVKVYNGKDDISVGRADAIIKANDERDPQIKNEVFHGNKLSELVNNGGQYAEISLNSDGKLTKLVFLDDDANNKNKLSGHHYSVSRNLVREVRDKNLRYHLNDNKTYGDVKAEQTYAGAANKLFTVGRLPSESYGYASDVKFYQIDGAPTRHDKNYEGEQLTVNAGFDRLRQADISVIEKNDVGAHEPDFNSTKNIYEVSDLAVNNNGDLVAVFSFKKSMDEVRPQDYKPTPKKYDVRTINFAKADGSAIDTDLKTIAGYQNKFVVYVDGYVNKDGKLEDTKTPVSGLDKDNFTVEFGGVSSSTVRVTDATELTGKPGYYTLTLSENIDTKRAVKVIVHKGNSAVNVGIDGSEVAVEDKTPEIGIEGGEVAPIEKGYVVNVKNVVNDNLAIIEVVDKNGTPLPGLKIVGVEADANIIVSDNGNGTYTVQGTELSGKQLIVNGELITLPTLMVGEATLKGLTGAAYQIGSQSSGEVELSTGTLVATNIDEKATYKVTPIEGLSSLKFDADKKQIVANAEELNKLPAKQYTTVLSAGGAKLNITFTVQEVNVGGVTPGKAEVKADAVYDVVMVPDAEQGKVLVSVNGEGAVQATEVDLAGKTTSQAAAEAIKTALTDSGKYTGYTFTAEAKAAGRGKRSADPVWTVKIAADRYNRNETVSLDILPAPGTPACVRLENPVINAAQAAKSGVAEVAIPDNMDAGEWVLSIKDNSASSAETKLTVTVKGTENPADVALLFAREGAKSGLKDKLEFTTNKGTVVITEKLGQEGKILESKGVTLTKSTTDSQPAAELSATGSVTTEGVTEVKETAKYTVESATADTLAVIVKGADSFEQEVSVTSSSTTAATAAGEIRDALTGDGTVNEKYDIGGSAAEVVLTAKTGTQGANVTLEVKSSDSSKLTLSEVSENKTGVAGVKGVAELTVEGTASAAKAGNWTLKLGTKTVSDIVVADQDTAEAVAGKIESKVKSDLSADVDVKISGAKLTFTEKVGKEGTVVSSGNTTVTFEKAEAVSEGISADAATASTDGVTEVKETAKYTVTTATADTLAVIVKGAASFEQEVSVTSSSATAATAAGEIRTALSSDGTVNAKYDISGSGEEIILTAKTATAGQNVTLEVKSSDSSKLTLSEVSENKAGVEAVKGVLSLTIKGTANTTNAGNWTLKLGTKTVSDIVVADQDTAEAVAGKIESKVKSDLSADVDVNISGATLTFTEKTGKEGTVLPTSNNQATFTKS